MTLAPEHADTASRLLGSELRPAEVFRDGLVGRFQVADGGTVIVKVEASEREELALRFLDGLGLRAGPRLLGAEGRLLVLEDLAGPSLADTLRADDPALARRHAVAFAAALGRLHGDTVGTEAGFADPAVDRLALRGFRPEVGALAARVASEGLPEPGFGDAELAPVFAELLEPGPFLAFSNRDPCPDNLAFTADGVRFFDFDAAAFQHALLDAAHLRLPFPNCWCRRALPADVAAEMEGAYRAALVRRCPEAADDRRYERGMAMAMVAWLLWLFANRYEVPRVVAGCERLVEPAAAHGLPGVARWCEAVAEDLRARFPAVAAEPTYPAFGGPPLDVPT